jgi:hypothetical protein|tara:strand:+ start:2624 stop:3451 length:828 start_codon:yes stop_codon:yes gene_type:complete
MTRKVIIGGCSFTKGSELSDDIDGKKPSKKSWAYQLYDQASYPGHRYPETDLELVNTAFPGLGNEAIARRVFQAVIKNERNIEGVAVMWSFISRYDWAMPRHKALEDTRWVSISPWDTTTGNEEAFKTLAGSQVQQEQWRVKKELFLETGVKGFADALYRYAASQYHEVYLSWKSIIWLQNILEKKGIPYMFTLADNSLFYDKFKNHKENDTLLSAFWSEIDVGKWFIFGERMMGFNQWSILEGYDRGITHPLDQAHQDAVKLMLPTFNKLIGGK